MGTILYTNYILSCLDYPIEELIDSGVAQTLLNQIIQFPDESVISIFMHISSIHHTSPSIRLLYRSEQRLGHKVIEKLKSCDDDHALDALSYFEYVSYYHRNIYNNKYTA